MPGYHLFKGLTKLARHGMFLYWLQSLKLIFLCILHSSSSYKQFVCIIPVISMLFQAVWENSLDSDQLAS